MVCCFQSIYWEDFTERGCYQCAEIFKTTFLKNSEIDTIFFSDGYNLAKKHLENGVTISKFLDLSEELYASIDSLMNAFISRCLREGKTVDCRKGCSICCSQAVLSLPYEVLYLFHYIRENFTDEKIHEIKEKTFIKNEVTKDMKVMEFLHYKYPCPLLMEGICIVYKARPMACRTYISSGKDGCIDEYHNPSDTNIFPDLYAFTIRAGRMINEGIAAYLTQKQIFPAEGQIESMLFTAFERENTFDCWIKGENIFQKRNYSEDEIIYLHN
jgi:Fe-S-cluster containining protein